MEFKLVLEQIGVVAVFVKALVDFAKKTKYNEWAEKYQQYFDTGLSLLFSAALCTYWGVDIFAVAGLTFDNVAWLGSVFTGVFAGLGSGVFHDLVELLKMFRAGLRAK